MKFESILTFTKLLAYLVFFSGIAMSIYFDESDVLVNMTYAASGIIAVREGGKFANKYMSNAKDNKNGIGREPNISDNSY